MNTMQQMKDPAAGVPRELLPHLHLVSKNRYPVNNNPSIETVVAYLIEATKVVREGQPVQWQFLDCPQDGTIFLTWQPPDMGINFASDGYIWADQESPFSSDVRGYTLQMFVHKSGFRPQGEATTAHSRRRYRLLPPRQPMGAPPPDTSLWLIHYSKAAPQDMLTTSSVILTPAIHAQLQQRRMLMSAGAVARKEFMLHDRSNWPTINLPAGIARHGAAGGPNAHRRGPSFAGHEPTIEEEEDVSRGDALDLMTPRDISRMRYEQHHEWMEEILESPYRTMQIIPPDLGLGRKGELETLTKAFFLTPTGVPNESIAEPKTPRIGKLDSGRAEEFTKQANQKLANMQLELQRMKQIHQKRMAKLKKVTTLSTAEKKLRSAHSDLGQRPATANSAIGTLQPQQDPVDVIVAEVEETTGKTVYGFSPVTLVAKGGYQESRSVVTPAPEQTPQSSAPSKPPQQSTTPATQQPSMPQQDQQPKEAPVQKDANHQNGVPSPPPLSAVQVSQHQQQQQHQQHHQQQQQQQQQQQHHQQQQHQHPAAKEPELPPITQDPEPSPGEVDVDIDMAELDQQSQVDDVVGDSNDWVMVDDNGMGEADNTSSMDNMTKPMNDPDPVGEDHTPLNTGFTPDIGEGQTPQIPDQTQQQPQITGPPLPTGHTPVDTADFDFDDVNTAGDALADYGAGDDDDDLNLDNMDDSAFGDAFHPPDENDLS